MTEEQKEPLDAEENVVWEGSESAASGDSLPAEEPAGEKKSNLPIVAIVTAILTLCAAVACIAAVLSATSEETEETVTPAPMPTQGPSKAMIAITEPNPGQMVDVNRPIRVQGKGIGLPEANVIVQILDAQGNVLAQQPTTLQGKDVGIGGEGTWSVELTVDVEPGTAGKTRAFSSSPADGSVVAEDTVDVDLGSAPSLEDTVWVWDQSLPDVAITATFEDGRVSGSAGCNTYQGDYTTGRKGGKNTIRFSPLATTRMMCEESIMELETQFLAGFESATSYVIEDHTLSMTYPGGMLVFYDQSGPRPRGQ